MRRNLTALVLAGLVVGASQAALLGAATPAGAEASTGVPATEATATPAPPPASDPTPPARMPMAPAENADGLTADQHQALQTAHDEAASSGSPVTVDGLTTETSTTTADPSGTTTVNSTLLPTRAHKDGVWVPLDATLARNPDGTYSPTTAAGPLKLSGGGAAAPLAVLGTSDQQLTIGWPTALPTPTASGDALTYPDVLPDVDLKVTATTLGGFSEVLIVKSAVAAANPALLSLTLHTQSTGMTVTQDDGKGLEAVTAAGAVAFSSPPTIMWDSAQAKAPLRVGAASTASAPATNEPSVSPPLGAHIADVDTQLGSGTLTLAPDQDMLASTETVYPLYIDPSWIPHPASGSRQHWNEVQEGCPTQADNYDSTQYGDPGVGYNGYSGCIGLERSYFQLSFPSSVWRTHIVSAKVNVAETSASQCDTTSTIHMYLSPAINSKFSWNTKPKPGSKINDASFAAACTSYVSAAFDATSTVVRAAANSWTAFAYVLVNGNESDKYHFKRFATNPSLSITYNHVPNVPTSPAVKLNASTYTCATSTPYPILGETVATTPPTLDSVVSDPDKDVVQATYTYWTGTGAIKYSVKSKDVSSGQHAPASFPSSYISNLDDGTVVLWKVSVTDGEDTTDNTSYCHFIVDQHAPIEPTVTADVYPDIDAGGLPGAPAGTPGTFTAKVDPGNSKNNAVKFVFGLDAPPPTSGAPASQTKTATNNMAQFSATPVAPGTHILYVYAVDSAGNDSPPHEYKFTAVGHLAHPYASLSAAFNNTAVSNDNAPTAANADGVGNSFSLQDLQAAGWQPGQKITVDGATFTLPNFGSGAPDNVLAANQTIGMSDAKGSALVILATATGATSPFRHAPEDDASPYVPDGTLIGATNCAYSGSYYDDCSEASGTITYNNSSGTTPPDTYKLAVPDWVISPGALAAVTVPHRNSASGQVNQPRRIFAFAIPLAPGVPISSVSLPDLSDQAADRTPALHIFGMAVRDTASASSGQSWTGAWTSPIDTQYAFGGQGFGDQTFRTALLPSISGSGVRIRLSNAQGSAPLTLNDVTVAHQGASPASASAPPVPVTFNAGATSVTLPVGGELYSDPVSIPAVAAQRLLVSFHLVTAIPYLGMHTNSSDAYTYISPLNSGDHAMDTSDSAFNLTGRVFSHAAVILTGLDVLGDSPHPTIAVLGDGLRNVTGSTIDATAPRLSDNVATAFRTNGQYTEPVGVVSAGITNNLLTQDQNAGGHAALTRLDRDVLSIPGIKTVVVYQGMNDLLAGTDDTVVTNAYHALGDQLAAWKIRTVFLTLTPCGGNTACTDQVEDDRVTVNQGIANYVMALPPGIAELDANGATAIDDPNSTTTPAKQDLSAGDPPLDFDAGDHVNLTADGYAAISQTLTNDLSILFPPITP